MLRGARVPKVHDWLINYVVKKSPHAEELRVAWIEDPDPVVAGQRRLGADQRAGGKGSGRIGSGGAAGHYRSGHEGCPGPAAMGNEHLPCQIGIAHSEHRVALAIGEELEVLKDYPRRRAAPPRLRRCGSRKLSAGRTLPRRVHDSDFPERKV